MRKYSIQADNVYEAIGFAVLASKSERTYYVTQRDGKAYVYREDRKPARANFHGKATNGTYDLIVEG